MLETEVSETLDLAAVAGRVRTTGIGFHVSTPLSIASRVTY